MRPLSYDIRPLASPAFVGALALLVLNDFVFKALFHNAVTGKVSDFAGLFAVAFFAATLWPRWRRLAGVAIAASFASWKSPYVDPLISWLNALSPFTIGRTVDLADLVALPMIPVGIWAAAHVSPSASPRVLQWALAILAPVAFTATSVPQYLVRSTMEVPRAAVVDEAVVRDFVDELAERHGLRCSVCDPLSEGRVYAYAPGGLKGGSSSLVVHFDDENRALFFVTTGYGRDGKDGVLALAAEIRAGMGERFPGTTTTAFEDTPDSGRLPLVTSFEIEVPGRDVLAVESSERAKRALSSIVEEVARTHGLRTDLRSLVYYAGRRVGIGAEERDFVLVPDYVDNATLRVAAVSRTARFDELQRAVAEDLAQRLEAAFGTNVRRSGAPRE